MAAIGKIRKHGVLLMIIIGVALLAFIVGDLTQLLPSLTNKNLLAKVGKETIRMDGRENSYTTYYEQNRVLLEFIQDKSSSDEAFDQQVHDITWAQIKEEAMLDEQLGKLGMKLNDQIVENINNTLVNDIEKILMALSNNQYRMLTQSQQVMGQLCYKFLNQGASLDNIKQIFTNIDEYRNTPNSNIYLMYKAIERMACIEARENAYFGLANNSLYFSNPLLEQITKDNTEYLVQASVINLNNPTFDAIEINIDEKEAKEYFKKHIDKYTSMEALRDMDYAVIPILPTEEDQKATQDSVFHIFNRFANAANIQEFTKNERKIDKSRAFNRDGNFWSYNGRNASFVQVDTLLYLENGKTALNFFGVENEQNNTPMPKVMDSVINHAPAGTLLTPYFDANSGFWYFGKVRSVAYRPDSIKVSFIAVDFKTDLNTNSTRTKEEAQSLMDSIQRAVAANPAEIFPLLATYNPQLQKDSTMWLTDMPDTLYNKLINTNINGCYLQERENDFLLVAVFDKTAPKEKRQYVLYPVPLEVSRTTIDMRRKEANALAAECNDVTKLNEVAKEKGIVIVEETDIRNMQGILYQSQLVCRELVSWAYSEDTEIGQVAHSPFTAKYLNVEGQEAFIVAGLKHIRNAGKPDYESVKHLVEADMKAEKKREMVEKKLQDTLAKASLQEVAQSYNAYVRDSIRVHFSEFQSAGIENAIIGKIAGMKADSKPVAMCGKNAAYMIAVHSSEPTTAPANNTSMVENYAGQVVIGNTNLPQLFMSDLEKNLKITDRRHNFYRHN